MKKHLKDERVQVRISTKKKKQALSLGINLSELCREALDKEIAKKLKAA